jgi:hypothetical protein
MNEYEEGIVAILTPAKCMGISQIKNDFAAAVGDIRGAAIAAVRSLVESGVLIVKVTGTTVRYELATAEEHRTSKPVETNVRYGESGPYRRGGPYT